MALTAKQQAAREGKLTASQVKVLMEGDAEAVLNLWKLHVGDPSYKEPDLSRVWPVRLGEATEPLNLEWYGNKHGEVTRIGEVVIGNPEWMACTLDGWDVVKGCPVECKHVGGREPIETIVQRYTPQCTWQMMVMKSKECALSVIMGTNEPIVEVIAFNSEYAAELMKRAEQFMACVESLTPPVTLSAVAAPVAPIKIYQMETSAEWKALADRWLQCVGAAKTEAETAKQLKALVPEDAIKAIGCGISITRNRAGSLALREDRGSK